MEAINQTQQVFNQANFINLTYMCMAGNQTDQRRPAAKIRDWHSKKSTVEFIGLWETLYNPAFNKDEFEIIRNSEKYLQLSVKQWVERTNAKGLLNGTGAGRGHTYAHKDLAYDFGINSIPAFRFAFFTGDFKTTDKYLYPLTVVRQKSTIDKKEVFAKFAGKCAYCGCGIDFKTFNVDHVMPRIMFGNHLADENKIPHFLKHLTLSDVNHPDNLMPACEDCNREKRYKDLESWRMASNGRIFYFETVNTGTHGK